MTHLRTTAVALAALLALVACDDPSVRKLQPELRITPTHVTDDGAPLLDFGPVPVLNEKRLSLVVDNLGQAELHVALSELRGPEGVFTPEFPDGGLTLVVPAAGSAELPVLFVPPAEESYDGTLVLTHDDATQPPIELRLLGVGSTVGRIRVTPEALDFGRVGVRTQATLGVRIESIGTADLIVQELSFVPGSDEAFSFAGSARTPAVLPAPQDGAPGAEVSIAIRCAPVQGSPLVMNGVLRIVSTDPERRELLVPLTATLNEAPLAVIVVPPGEVPGPGSELLVDGTQSSDPDGDLPLSFAWRVFRRPIGSQTTFDDATSPTPRLVFDVPGVYELGLDVADGAGLSCEHPQGDARIPCVRTVIDVKSTDDLVVELVWNHPETDLDLHYVEGGFSLYSAQDCHFGNRTPDFGEDGPDDDPALTRDDLNGFGPETVVHAEAPEGRFDVSVIYYSDHGAAEPLLTATVRVYVYGILAAEMSRELPQDGAEWDVLSIDWPAGTLTALDRLQEAPPP